MVTLVWHLRPNKRHLQYYSVRVDGTYRHLYKLLCTCRLHKSNHRRLKSLFPMSYVIAFRTEYDLRATYVENRGHILQIFIHVKFTGLMGVKTD